MGLDTGPARTGYLAVGAAADLAFFDLDVDAVDDTIENLATDGAGRAVATLIDGVVRSASAVFTRETGVSAHD
jgi:formylmethanofuran dehydrogenase subunit A